MAIDYEQEAKRLIIIDMFKPNVTGWVTPRALYDPAVKHQGVVIAPRLARYEWWMDHGTVGTNTLRFWGEGGSLSNGAFSLAQFLIPRDTTQYADGRVYDTKDVVFKMVPDGYACNHTGLCIYPIGNHNTLGVEYESKQNGTHDITERQYIKGALLYTYNSRLKTGKQDIRDHRRVSHGLVATPWGRRSDPWAGGFDYAYSWAHVYAIRLDPRVFAFWGL